MHTTLQNLSFSSISSILIIILVYLTIPTYSIPVPYQTPTSQSSDNDTSSIDDGLGGGGGSSNAPDKMEVMNWILAAISIVIVVELIFWIFKCVNMVRKGGSANEGDGTNNNGISNRPFDATSNGLDDECLPPYDGLSLPKYCEAMEMNTVLASGGDEGLRSSPLPEDEISTPTIIVSQEDNEGGHDERVEEANESDTMEINGINNQTSTVVVEMNQVTTIKGDTEEDI